MNNKKITLSTKVKVGVTLGVVAAAYVWHRRVLDATITLSQAAVQDTMWGSFDEGVRYGLQLAKESAAAVTKAGEATTKASEYAFGAFDKTA